MNYNHHAGLDGLACAVILLAITDLRRTRPYRVSAAQWLVNTGATWAEELGIDPCEFVAFVLQRVPNAVEYTRREWRPTDRRAEVRGWRRYR